MAKKIDWLEQFANDQYKQLQKTASINKIAEQIIVNCSTYPNAKVGSLVDYENNKYKVIDTEYHDKSGPGILLEKIAEVESPTASGEVSTKNGNVPPTSVENDSANCGDCAPLPKTASIRTAAAEIDEDFDELEINDDNDELANFDDSGSSEYPSIIPTPGGVKPIQSEPIIGPGQKKLTDAPYHPTYDPGEEYALDIPDTFQEAADRTANIINQEDAIDRTTVEGHYSWNQEIDNMLEGNAPGTSSNYDSLADFDDSGSSSSEDSDVEEDTDIDNDIDTNTDIDTDDDIDEDIDNTDDTDDVDVAVDSMLDTNDDEDFENTNDIDDEDIPFDDSDSTEMDEDSSFNNTDDEDIPFDEDNSTDTNNDFSSDVDNSFDEELPDANDTSSNDFEEEKKEASGSRVRQLSRLAFKNHKF